MTTIFKRIALCLGVVAVLTASTFAARDLAGDWSWVSEFPGGQVEGTMHVMRTDTVYSGTGTQVGPGGTIDLKLVSARVVRDSVWIVVASAEMQTSAIGAFTTDSTVVGTWSAGDQGGPFRMMRTRK